MQRNKLQSTLLWSVAGLLFVGVPVILWLVPPPLFSSATVSIPRGTSVSEAAEIVTDAGIVFTPELVIVPLRASGSDVVAGTYAFNEAVNASTVVSRLTSGDFQVPQGRVVIPEGFTNEQIADRLEENLDSETFSRQEFIEKAYQQQGFLYPDTYDFHTNATAEEVISVMRSNFDFKIESLQSDIQDFSYTLDDIVNMAALVELEAADYEIRRRIAGVLWKRLDINMPLQVDAVFVPLIGRNTYELTRDDLRTDSPYNLYTNTGLPPRPIANPSIKAIEATIHPIITDDLYYLSDRDRGFYFAETLSEHAQNRRDYLETDID